MSTSGAEGPAFVAALRELVGGAGYGHVESISALAGGGNNRVYRLVAGGRDLLLKAYFRDVEDTRDRLRAEFEFSRFAWDHGVRAIPEPIASDVERGWGLFGFIHGRMLAPNEVTPLHVDEALAFFNAVNRHRHEPAAQALGNGSESAFTFAEHLANIASRVARLERMIGDTSIDKQARAFVRDDLRPAWERICTRLRSSAPASSAAPIANDQRCISPSDFGFHNAILTTAGPLIFHDFEYAGWDDPAKTICDFFCQPRLPVPSHLFENVLDSIISANGFSPSLLHRTRALYSVYRIKWCCIILNEFLPLGSRRRNFADRRVDGEASKFEQLAKARVALSSIDSQTMVF